MHAIEKKMMFMLVAVMYSTIFWSNYNAAAENCRGYIRSWTHKNLYWFVNNERLELTREKGDATLFSLTTDGFELYSLINLQDYTPKFYRSFKVYKENGQGCFIKVESLKNITCPMHSTDTLFHAFQINNITKEKSSYNFRLESKNFNLHTKSYVQVSNNANIEFAKKNAGNNSIWEIKAVLGCVELFKVTPEDLVNITERATTTIQTTTTSTTKATSTKTCSESSSEKSNSLNNATMVAAIIQDSGDLRLSDLDKSINNKEKGKRKENDQKIMNATVEMEKFLLKSANNLPGNVSLQLDTKYFEGEIGKGYTPLVVTMQDNFINAKSRNDAEKSITYTSIVYKNLHRKLSNDLEIKRSNLRSTQGKYQINSMLVSLSVQESGAISTVYLTLQHQINATIGSNVCAFWNETGLGFWSTEGCTKINFLSNHSHTACSCNHLTNFAILTSFGNTIPPIHAKILSTLSLICCGISITFLFVGLILLAVLLNGDRRHSRHFVHFNLMLALFMVQVIFVSGVEATHNRSLCRGIALSLHYFLLATFGWMLMEGLHLYVTVIKVFADAAKKLRFYFLFAWGYPIIVISITAGINIEYYGSNDYCWMTENGFWSVMGPMLAVMLLNTVILIVLVKEIVQLSKTDGLLSDTKIAVRSAVFLMPLLGITWIFAMLTFYSDHLVFQYIFAVTNSLQGFMLTLLHCFCNRDVRKALKRKAEIWGHSSSANSIRFHSQRISRSHDSYSISAFRSSSKKASTVTLLEKNHMNQNNGTNGGKKSVKISVSFDTTATQLNGS